MYKHHLRELINHTLIEMAALYGKPFWSNSAVELLMLTAAQESHLGYYLKQIKGPALGMMQMEPETFEWLQSKYPEILGGRKAEELVWDLKLSIRAARLRYWVVEEPLPEDAEGWAKYWDRYYNCNPTKGFPEEALKNYRELAL